MPFSNYNTLKFDIEIFSAEFLQSKDNKVIAIILINHQTFPVFFICFTERSTLVDMLHQNQVFFHNGAFHTGSAQGSAQKILT